MCVTAKFVQACIEIRGYKLLEFCYLCRATGLDILNNVATGHSFKPWEVSDSASYQKNDLAVYLNSPEAR